MSGTERVSTADRDTVDCSPVKAVDTSCSESPLGPATPALEKRWSQSRTKILCVDPQVSILRDDQRRTESLEENGSIAASLYLSTPLVRGTGSKGCDAMDTPTG